MLVVGLVPPFHWGGQTFNSQTASPSAKEIDIDIDIDIYSKSLQKIPALLLSLEQPDDPAQLFIIFPAGGGWEGQHMRGVMLSTAMAHLSFNLQKIPDLDV